MDKQPVSAAEKARAFFLQGYNCSQSVAAAFADVMGLTEEQAARMASALGGGLCRMRESCGAVTGAMLVLGALQGNADAGAYGDRNAFIFAMEMDPIQLRISDAMAIAADTGPRKKGIFSKKDVAPPPEVALINEGHIVITDLDNDLFRANKVYRKKKASAGKKKQEQSE